MFRRRTLRDGTETATSRTKAAEDHESGSTAMKALVDIGAPRRLANGMQIQTPQLDFQVVEGFKMSAAFSRPLRQPRCGANINIDKLAVQP
jgi:hypothetical protein